MTKLLCIEDQPDIQTILKFTLEAGGRFQVIQAESGADGLARAADANPDAILLDFSLPDMTGFDVLGLLKKQQSTAAIPVILLTATTSPQDIEACKGQGALDVLIKPFNPRTLPGQLETLLRGHVPAR